MRPKSIFVAMLKTSKKGCIGITSENLHSQKISCGFHPCCCIIKKHVFCNLPSSLKPSVPVETTLKVSACFHTRKKRSTSLKARAACFSLTTSQMINFVEMQHGVFVVGRRGRGARTRIRLYKYIRTSKQRQWNHLPRGLKLQLLRKV